MSAKSKSEMMKRLRAQRLAKGLIQISAWVKNDPAVKKRIYRYIEKVNKEYGVEK
jgi:hypothetical protein